jgi:mRNA interferase RelE/StbE
VSGARFGFAAHPDALEDLRRLPRGVQELAVLGLQQLVHGEQRGQPLDGREDIRLRGARKFYLDPRVRWRVVYQERAAPARSAHRREIYLIAAGPRQGMSVYRIAAERLARLTPHEGLDAGRRSRAALARTSRTTKTPTPPPSGPSTPGRTPGPRRPAR